MPLKPPHLVACGRSLCCLFLVAQWITESAGARAANLLPHAQASAPVALVPGASLRQEIIVGEAHHYTLDLIKGQYAHILVRQDGSDIVVTIFEPGGKSRIVDRPNTTHGPEAVSLVARQSGAYRLELRAAGSAGQRGRYEIALAELRAAQPRDESRVAAEVAVSEGEILRARKTAASLPKALERFNQAVALWRALDEPYETAVALYGRCLTQRLLGVNEQAAADCAESATVMHSLGDGYGASAALTGRAWAYLYLGDTARALQDFNDATELRLRIGEREDVPFDLYGVGWAYALRGEYGKALDYFQQSLRLLDSLAETRGRDLRLAAIGEVYRRTGRYAEAAEYLSKSLELSRGGGDHRGEAETVTNLGWCQYALGRLPQARELFAAALPMRRETGDSTGEAFTLLGLAHVEGRQGNLYDALQHAGSALAIIESLRTRVVSQPLRLSFFALAQDYYEFNIDLLMRMHRIEPGRGYAAEALEISERARARGLLDQLYEARVEVKSSAPAELLERESDLRSRLDAAAGYHQQLINEGAAAAQAAAAAREVDELYAALEETQGRIRQASPRYAALTHLQPFKVADMRGLVEDDTLLLEYSLGGEHSYLWVVSPDSVTGYELPGRDKIERAAARVLELLTARDHDAAGETAEQRRARVEWADSQYEEAAARLSDILLAPAARQLGSKRLVVVVPGVLQLIPFGALPAPQDAGGGRPLILDHELVSLPSASMLVLLRRYPATRQRPTNLIAVLADPVFSRADERLAESPPRRSSAHFADGEAARATAAGEEQTYRGLPRLFRTRWEAEQIAALAPKGSVVRALDFAASREIATGPEVAGSRIIHFATHAILDDEHPELSGIVLSMFDSEGRPRDGFLRAHDIFNLKLSADLVTLSACRTALGRDFRGEGLVGITRGFMYAGVPRVVGSLWASDDKATAELMVRFYRRMLKEGLRPAAALRAAQIEMLRDRRWQSPYFWAGFTLQGEWR